MLDHGVAGAAEARFEAIRDYHANRVQAKSSDPGAYRPLEPKALYLEQQEWDGIVREWPMHATTPFHEPESATVLDFAVDGPRDFAPERAQNANVYEAVGKHIASLQRAKKKVVIASYSVGARERLSGLLADHGVTGLSAADDWQEALGRATPLPFRGRAGGGGYPDSSPDPTAPTPTLP